MTTEQLENLKKLSIDLANLLNKPILTNKAWEAKLKITIQSISEYNI